MGAPAGGDLTRAEIVTADGTARTCDAQREPELFWALRGGGGGNFGVVTSLVLATSQAPPLAIGFVTWPWSLAHAVIRAWQAWMAVLPDEVWSNVHLDSGAGSEPNLLVHRVAMESAATLAVQLDRLAAAVGAAPDSRTVFMRPYAEAMLVEAGCAQRTVSQCHLAGSTSDGQLERETYAARSSIAMAPLSNSAIDGLVNGLDALRAFSNFGAGSVLIDAMGGAVARIAPDATAFPHRSATATLQFIAGWNVSDPARPPTLRRLGCGASTAASVPSSGRAHTSITQIRNSATGRRPITARTIHGSSEPARRMTRAVYSCSRRRSGSAAGEPWQAQAAEWLGRLTMSGERMSRSGVAVAPSRPRRRILSTLSDSVSDSLGDPVRPVDGERP